MTPAKDVTMAARVPIDLRAEAERVVELKRQADPEFDLSHVIRRAVREYVDRELGRAPTGAAGLFAPREGTTRRHDRSTSKAAASDVAPRSGSQRRRALEVIANAGGRGATADEVIAVLEGYARVHGQRPPAVNGVARRVTDLLEVDAIEEARCNGTCSERQCDGTHTVTRKTRHGSDAIVWTITDKGRKWLEEETTA